MWRFAIHNFKKCRVCGDPVRGNRFYCPKTACQRRAAADRKARSRARKAGEPSTLAVVEQDQADEGWTLEEFLAMQPSPGHYEDARLTSTVGNHGYPLNEVYRFLVEATGWLPGPVPPPSPYYLPEHLREAFKAWRAAQ